MDLSRGCDVAVVGAGALGCAVAWRLSGSGLSVVLVEKTRPGAEASSAAAGLLAAQHEGAQDGVFFRLLARSERMWTTFAEEIRDASGVDLSFRRTGILEAAFSASEAEPLLARQAWQRQAGFAAEFLDGRAVHALLPALAPEVEGGLWLPEAGQVDAQRLAATLWACAARSGVRLFCGEVQRLVVEHDRVGGLVIDGQSFAAGAVVVAAGAFSALIEGTGLPSAAVRPVRGQIASLDAPAPFEAAVFGARGYLAPKPDGRVLVGSTMEEVGFDKRVTGDGVRSLLERAGKLCPVLHEAPVRALWAGLRPATRDGLPALGPVPAIAGLHLAVGHLRNGILLTPVTAELLAASVRGEPLDVPPELLAARLFA